MAPLYRCPGRQQLVYSFDVGHQACDFEGPGKKLKNHMKTSQCRWYCEDVTFLKPDQIHYENLPSPANKKMYCYDLGNRFQFHHLLEGYSRFLLQDEKDVLHYLEVRQKKTTFAFEITTGFDRQNSNRLDMAFVLSQELISDWEQQFKLKPAQSKLIYRRHTKQFASKIFNKTSLVQYSHMYVVLIINKLDYESDSVNLFRHSIRK